MRITAVALSHHRLAEGGAGDDDAAGDSARLSETAKSEQQRANTAEAELTALKTHLRAQSINPEDF